MGLAMRGLVWRPQLRTLRDHCRCATYDHRGLGESDPVRRGFSMSDMADDAARVLDALGWDRAHVVGVSMGGMIAQELALRAPSRLQSLALIVTHAGGGTTWLPRREGLAGFVTAWTADPDQRARGLARMLYPPEWLARQEPDAMRAGMADRLDYTPPRGTVLRQLWAVRRHHTAPRLRDISAPTLVVRAARDVLVHPRNSELLAARIPTVRLLDYPDAGHGVIHQEADDLNAHLLEHFTAHD